MEHTSRDSAVTVEIEPLTRLGHLKEIGRGIATVLGLGLLWVLETGRNAWFRLLDRLNVRVRGRRRASAFPPGRPRRRSAA
jgi:hypothetical protein